MYEKQLLKELNYRELNSHIQELQGNLRANFDNFFKREGIKYSLNLAMKERQRREGNGNIR